MSVIIALLLTGILVILILASIIFYKFYKKAEQKYQEYGEYAKHIQARFENNSFSKNRKTIHNVTEETKGPQND